ncbi:MAG TPA: dihydropteroate synthase [Stellaceae bacterium]|nr:dihydropteroate synthase [Stellaceae bacterium]
MDSGGRGPVWGLPAHPEGDPGKFYLRPVGRLTAGEAEAALAAGHAIGTGRPGEAAPTVEILVRSRKGGAAASLVSATEFVAWLTRNDATPIGRRLSLLAARLALPRPDWAGLKLSRPLVMGVVNVTPDSFSDGGDFLDPDRAIAQGRAMLAAGADLVDVGGESTRPGAEPLSPDIEAARVLPVIRALAGMGAVISIDTRHPSVMAQALDAGARIVNDVTALRAPDAIELAAKTGAAVALMHMQGDPRSMQENPRYQSAPLDVLDFLEARIAACEAGGLSRSNILVDPGIGFGKTVAHNLDILAMLGLFRTTGCGVLLGVSRKGFIGRIAHVPVPRDRLPGSLAAALAGIAAGADMLRVHDVAETVQALRVVAALESAGESV